jgi:hypothetical protein
MSTPLYLGLDTATVTGVALLNPVSNSAIVYETKGIPNLQYKFIDNLLKGIEVTCKAHVETIAMEELRNFRNAKVTRSLLGRYGFILWSLRGMGYEVQEIAPKVARAKLNFRDKESVFRGFIPYLTSSLPFTSNHADALALALYVALMDGYECKLESLKIKVSMGEAA